MFGQQRGVQQQGFQVKPGQRFGRVSWQGGVQKQAYIFCSVAISLLILTLRQLGSLEALELFAYDTLVRLQGDRGPAPELLIVGITEADIRAQQQWPLSDQVVADLLAKLQTHRPKAIGLDIYRDIPNPPGYNALQAQLQAANVFAITALGTSQDDFVPPPPEMPSERVGFNDFVIDTDGILRRNFIYADLGDEKLYSLALRLSLHALASEGITLKFNRQGGPLLGRAQLQPLVPDAGGYQAIDNTGYQIMLQYRSAEQATRQISLTQLLAGDFQPEWVQNKIVLIGNVAPSEKDFFYTPYSAIQDQTHVMFGVVIHAQMVSQLLSLMRLQQLPIWYWVQWQESLWIIIWAFTGGIIGWYLKHPISVAVALASALATLFILCQILFVQAGWIPLLPPALALVLTGGVTVAYLVFYRSFYDPLTGLPNRATFLKRLQTQVNKPTQKTHTLAVLFIDIDDFKAINESFGHRFGDRFLVTVAHQLRAGLPNVMIARVGADEFAVVLPQIHHSRTATETADQLQKLLSAPYQIQDQPLVPTASVGIALAQSGYRHQAESLLQDAHRATYRAKALGRERYEIFAQGMRTQAVCRFQLEMDLRQAINQKAFALHYQPIVSLKTGQLAGFESLIRWPHAQRGFVSPAEFIPVAEETGMILPLGQWILQQACEQMHQWHQDFPQTPPLFISINLSGKQFAQTNLADEVEAILQATGIHRRSVKLELTEGVAMEDVEVAINQLLRLKAMGLQLSLDDFGTGYSSLSYLHQFPTDTLKVDQSFVGRMEKASSDREVVSTIITLGHKLGMDIVAEGIETVEQLTQLRALNCEYGQGYYFSKPISTDQATELLRQNPQW
jgi:diguanylate cyclase (GGDEF)-like protein